MEFVAKAKAKPIRDAYKVFLPKLNLFGSPAEIIIRTAPTLTPITARGVAMSFTKKLRISVSICLNAPKSHGCAGVPSQLTMAALDKKGTNNAANKQNKIIGKKILFIFLVRVPSAGFGPADFWFEAKYDIQFHHEGAFIKRL